MQLALQDQGDGGVRPHGPDPGDARILAMVLPRGTVNAREELRKHRLANGIPDRPPKAKAKAGGKAKAKPTIENLEVGTRGQGKHSNPRGKETSKPKAMAKKGASRKDDPKDCYLFFRLFLLYYVVRIQGCTTNQISQCFPGERQSNFGSLVHQKATCSQCPSPWLFWASGQSCPNHAGCSTPIMPSSHCCLL